MSLPVRSLLTDTFIGRVECSGVALKSNFGCNIQIVVAHHTWPIEAHIWGWRKLAIHLKDINLPSVHKRPWKITRLHILPKIWKIPKINVVIYCLARLGAWPFIPPVRRVRVGKCGISNIISKLKRVECARQILWVSDCINIVHDVRNGVGWGSKVGANSWNLVLFQLRDRLRQDFEWKDVGHHYGLRAMSADNVVYYADTAQSR